LQLEQIRDEFKAEFLIMKQAIDDSREKIGSLEETYITLSISNSNRLDDVDQKLDKIIEILKPQ